jgi:prepilin-type N-terminal cleavage/methylation domain-containing protein
MKITNKNKGFTILEIMLVITLMGILIGISIVLLRPNERVAATRNIVRKTDISNIYKALEYYKVKNKGIVLNTITTNYQEICDTGTLSSTDALPNANYCNGKLDLRVLVPTYIKSIPKDSQATDTASTGYELAKTSTNQVSIMAVNSELGQVIATNPITISKGLSMHIDASSLSEYNLTSVEVLVVAGGGGGGAGTAGGGGGGGVIYNPNFTVTPGTPISVTVGAGGSGKVFSSTNSAGNNGENSVFGSLTAIGGGGGGNRDTNESGKNGGSGGGGGGSDNLSGNNSGTGTTGQGFAGGAGRSGGVSSAGGGGGGAGEVGKDSPSSGRGGDGGNGLAYSISGISTYYGGGGGGGSHSGRSSGGQGGGGAGSENGPTYNAVSGSANTGGGGGGGGGAGGGQFGGNGGSGIVIVRYPGLQQAIGGTVSYIDGHTIHKFTNTGSTTFTTLQSVSNNSSVSGVFDLSGNNKFGTTGGSPIYSSDNEGSIIFDGIDDYINTPLVTSKDNSVTMSSWFKSSNINKPGQMIFYNGSDISGNGYGFAINNESTSDGKILLLYGAVSWINTGFQTVSNTWYNATMVIESNKSNKLYINGELVFTGPTANINTPTTHTEIARNDYVSTSRYFEGNISSVLMYDRVLTPSEIKHNFNASKSRFGL